jgi:hypothetical protein
MKSNARVNEQHDNVIVVPASRSTADKHTCTHTYLCSSVASATTSRTVEHERSCLAPSKLGDSAHE